jgi:hypothetical protein
VTAGRGVAIRRTAFGAFVIHARAARFVVSLIFQTVVALPRHLFTGAVDNVGGVSVANVQYAAWAVLIWVLICHELILSV